MDEFSSPIDIANRALQHVGANRIASLADDSKNASEVAFCYDKLRAAELRRNTWVFSTRRTVLRPIGLQTMELHPAAYVPTQSYPLGAIVADAEGEFWVSVVPDNLGNTPSLSAPVPQWEQYFGGLLVNPWQNPSAPNASGQAYFSGELVYLSAVPGKYQVYVSLTNSNSEEPDVPETWVSSSTPPGQTAPQPTVYNRQDVVTFNGYLYMSLIDLNSGNEPDQSPIPWNAATTYAANAIVAGIDGFAYQSIAGGNIGNDPTLTPAAWAGLGTLVPWTPAFSGPGTGSRQWLNIDATLSQKRILYPAGSGPVELLSTRNVFQVPCNHMRPAPQDPKAGSVSYLGAPSGLQYSDWTYEGKYIITRESVVINYRFIASVANVLQMDPMFCEGLAARIGLEICEILTQSNAKMGSISAEYKLFMTEARLVDGIESGPVEPPEDDFITCRI